MGISLSWGFLNLACVHVSSQERNKASNPNAEVVPLLRIQKMVQQLTVKDITGIRLYGDDFGCFDDDPIEVTDVSLINKFLNALHHAAGRSTLMLDYLDNIEIHLKPQGRTLRSPIHIQFLTAIELDSFGPEFAAALKALSKHQAEHVHHQVQSKAKLVKLIKIDNVRSISKPKEIAQLLAALKLVDERAFDYTVGGDSLLNVKLMLNNGEETQFNFVFLSARATNLEQSHPLPGILWDYYLAGRPTPK